MRTIITLAVIMVPALLQGQTADFPGARSLEQAEQIRLSAVELREDMASRPKALVIGSRTLIIGRGTFDIEVPGSGASTNRLTVGMECDASLQDVSVQAAGAGTVALFRESRNVYVTRSGEPMPINRVLLTVRTRALSHREQQCSFTVYDAGQQAPDTPDAGQVLYVDITPQNGPAIAECIGNLLRSDPARLQAAGVSRINWVYSPNGVSPDRGGILSMVNGADSTGMARRYYIDLRSRTWQSYSVSIGLPIPGGGMSMSGYKTPAMDRTALFRTGDRAFVTLFSFDVGSCWGR